jgi:RNA polymerase sigma-70 factor (ECF subfamily)
MEQVAAFRAAMPERLEIEELYRSHAAAVEHWAARLAGPSLEVEDIVQEVFLIAQRRLPKFRGDSTPATWLFGITERVIWHRRRKDRWRRWLGGSADDVAGGLPTGGPSPLEELERKDATRLFYKALDGVSERYRSALLLFELDDVSGEEIAALKGVRLQTLWVWLHRARAQLMRRFVEIEGGRS